MKELPAFSEALAYNFLLQIGFRFTTFALNAALLRFVTTHLLGIVNVRLMLLYTTLSFCAKEPFRKACVTSLQKEKNPAQILNVLWLCPIVCLVAAAFLIPIWIFALDRPNAGPEFDSYPEAVIMFAFAVLIECFAEPLWVVTQAVLWTRLKAVAEGVMLFCRSVLFFVVALWFAQDRLMWFGVAMVVSSCVYAVIYFVIFWRELRKRGTDIEKLMNAIFPQVSHGLDRQYLRLAWSFWSHSILKQLLTEGERYVMTFTGILNFSDQGVFDVISNLGSLVARLVFAPLEESASTFFSLTIQRDTPVLQQDKESFPQATQMFCYLLKCVTLIGLLICIFGMPYAYLALQIYSGGLFSQGSGPMLLRWYCFYILFLAINGITECFVFCVMSKSDVERHQKSLLGFCLVFCASAAILTKIMGTPGFVLANCINMLARIVWSCAYIRNFYWDTHYRPLDNLKPDAYVVLVLVIGLNCMLLSNALFCCDGFFNSITHVTVGAVFVVLTLGTISNREVELVHYLWDKLIRPKIKTS